MPVPSAASDQERPCRQFEIAPLIDRQDNLRRAAVGRSCRSPVSRATSSSSPGICPTIITVSALSCTVRSSETFGRAGHVKTRVQQDFSRIASRLDHRLSRQPCPHRVGADDKIGYAVRTSAHQLSDSRPIPPATLVQRSFMVIKRQIAPARLRVPENQQGLHRGYDWTPSKLSTSIAGTLNTPVALGRTYWVSLTFASWNQTAAWLTAVGAFRRIA